MLLEKISCPACGTLEHSTLLKSKDYRFKTTDESFNIVKCSQCNFVFLNPMPDKTDIIRFYASDFNKEDQTLPYKVVIEPFFKLLESSTIGLLKKYKTEGRILDIGCGNGSFILTMQNYGYDIWGCELNPDAKKYTAASLNGRILYKDIKECNFAPKSFDIITMFHSLEHIHDLGGLFREISRVLKDEGILYICVPNMDFFEYHIFRAYYYNLEVPRHLYFFTKKSLKDALLKGGFKVDKFLRNSVFELLLTPASFYHGIWNFLEDKAILRNNPIKLCTFFPLAIIRFMLRLFFIFNEQNIRAVCYLKK